MFCLIVTNEVSVRTRTYIHHTNRSKRLAVFVERRICVCLCEWRGNWKCRVNETVEHDTTVTTTRFVRHCGGIIMLEAIEIILIAIGCVLILLCCGLACLAGLCRGRSRGGKTARVQHPAVVTEHVVVPTGQHVSTTERSQVVSTERNVTSHVNRPTFIDTVTRNATVLPVQAVDMRHSVREFERNLRKIRKKNESVLHEEFQILAQRSQQRMKSATAAERHRRKNRFSDILPYDDNRVILTGADDYINASYIDGYKNTAKFVAAQGPIGWDENDKLYESTIDDFWRMIWKLHVECIVMLTECTENYKLAHYQFKHWYDSSAPHPSQLLQFVRSIQSKAYSKPIVVHCSAGVGRTGVFIAIWNIMDRARHEGIVDVFNEVDTLRSQRMSMVQTDEQYVALYEAAALFSQQ